MRNYRNCLALTTIAISAATLTACAQSDVAKQNATNANAGKVVQTMTHQHANGEIHAGESHGAEAKSAGHSDMAHGSTVHTHSTTLNFSSQPAIIAAGKPTTMTLQIVNKTDGAPINDFEVVHDQKLHFIVVSNDLQFFNHIHPQFVGDGKFQIETTLPRAGKYRLYADYKPQGQEGEVALQEISAGGVQPATSQTATSSTRLVADTPRGAWIVKNVASHAEGAAPAAKAARYQVALMPMPTRLEAGKDVMLHFQVRDANGKPVAKLEPYLGAQGHCVILSDDPKTYLHTHPMDASHDMGTMKMESGSHDVKQKAAADVMFHTKFPKVGLYKIWGQFKHNGKIVTAPFVVNVGAAQTSAAQTSAAQTSAVKSGATNTNNATSSTRSSTAIPATTAIPANAQKITVELPVGYKDRAATVQAGRPVALTFKLTSEAGCGNEITVPAANWSKTLKVGESATVVYTPTKSGTLKFACSMNMMAGSILVQ